MPCIYAGYKAAHSQNLDVRFLEDRHIKETVYGWLFSVP